VAPVTAIRGGDSDDNPQTEPDPNWTPLLITPPFPEHTSGTAPSVELQRPCWRNSAAVIEFQFVTTSDGLPEWCDGSSAFRKRAREAGLSRVYGGIHFPAANENGLETAGKLVNTLLGRYFPRGESTIR
jgi:hypothetical protein